MRALGSEGCESALGELETLAGSGLAGLLAFLFARITGEEITLAKGIFQIRVRLKESPGNTQLDRSDLPGDSAALGGDRHVELIGDVGRLEGVENLVLEGKSSEVFLKGALVNRDLPGSGDEGDTYAGSLATTGGGERIAHFSEGIGLKFVGLGLLRLVGVVGVVVDFELAENLTTEAIVGNHALHGTFNDELRAATAHLGDRLTLHAADISRVGRVGLILFFASGETHLGRIDNHHEISAIHVRGEERFAFSAKEIGGGYGDIAEDLTVSVDDVPLTFDFLGFGRKGFHFRWGILYPLADLATQVVQPPESLKFQGENVADLQGDESVPGREGRESMSK